MNQSENRFYRTPRVDEDKHPSIMHAFLSHEELLDACMRDETFIASIQRAADIMITSLKKGGKIIACGNGGSMSDAMHFCAELTGRLKDTRAPIAAIAISDAAHISCVANDFGYDEIFARFVAGVGNPGDVLLAITTSGNSENVIQALHAATDKKIRTVCLTGNLGGSMILKMTWNRGPVGEEDFDHAIIVPGVPVSASNIQQVHIIVIHILCKLIEEGVAK